MGGNIFSDPYNAAPEIHTLGDGSPLFDGLTLIEDVNTHVALDLDDPDYGTIRRDSAGRLGRMAKIDDSVTVDSAALQVKAMDGRHMSQISLAPRFNLVHDKDPSPVEGAVRN